MTNDWDKDNIFSSRIHYNLFPCLEDMACIIGRIRGFHTGSYCFYDVEIKMVSG